MMPMGPMDAQIILKGAEVSGEDLGIGYRRALETCAGMHPEYAVAWVGGVGYINFNNPAKTGDDRHWTASLDEAKAVASVRGGTIIRRYVTPEEKIS